jgi:CheY-like chemotaxis protein
MIQILLVEDNPGDVRLLKRAMKGFPVPFAMTVVENGEEALAFLNRENGFSEAPMVQLILLDWNLPRLHGREVLSTIKTAPRLKHIPVVVLTSSDASADINEAYDRHSNCYITKPLELKEYSWTIEQLEHFWFSCAKLPQS